MKIEKEIQLLAIRYFKGQISRVDEERVFRFICESEENYLQFQTWKHEWLLSSKTDDKTEYEWERLEAKMRTRETIIPMLPSSKFTFWRKIAIVAAIVVLTIGTTIGVWNTILYLQPETYMTLEAPYGEKSKITLPDSTVIWLNAGSILQYSNKFNTNNRRVKLEGEGYFEVTRHSGKQFIVETMAYDVVVKGTKFDVYAYPDDELVTTTLIEGSVVLLRGEQTLKMKPGESVRLNLLSGRFIRNRVNALQSKSWLKNKLEFDHITLKELILKLSRQYNVKIELESEELGNKAFRISLRNQETIGEVMTALQKIIPITVEHKEKYIYIRE